MNSPHLVVIGCGFAGLELIKHLNKSPYRITVLDKNNYFNFQPLMYQVASGGLGPDAIAYPLRKIISKMPNVTFRMAEVLEVDLKNNTVKTTVGDIPFDYLCIATGAKTNFFGNKVLETHCMQLKSIPDALDIRSDILQELEKALSETDTGKIKRILNFVIVGGGPTGVETAGALAEIKNHVIPADYKELDPSLMQVYLIEASHRVLSAMSEISSAKAEEYLKELGVNVLTNTSVTAYDPSSGILTLSDGSVVETDTVIWTAGVMGKTLEGIDTHYIAKGNRYKVDAFNRLEGFENVFVIGDLAYMTADEAYPNGHPMVATVAQQQGRALAKNLLRKLKNKPLTPFKYFNKGSMATVGRHKAVVEIGKIKIQGYLAWFGWMFLHLMYIVGFRNRTVVFVNWLWNYFTYQRAIRLIIRPFRQNVS
ncbi:NADH dehydrogenase [Thermaurantimonas aggregans]|uniref:NADH:ubiquinone reductase (non-electrogenic) n=1 Tax=Thermaurantimonas aggregans TaxID=2173829 RepID=A0A401XP08_9FLAO|nr:NAD(P)/FAD-dependent oxidoreductase [Thermaurantimonas aggregans]MCX8148039.1 NAD(P)/FAD-dependent oxidoreductase [Thermaurantimonas aggregans]GCD78740.1 NADH dehydrogenase [Thermaurantimonas aggregans]